MQYPRIVVACLVACLAATPSPSPAQPIDLGLPALPGPPGVEMPLSGLPRRIEQLGGEVEGALGREQLRRLAALALERSAAVREARANVRAAWLDVREAQGARLPQVTLEASSRWSNGPASARAAELDGDIYTSTTASMPLWDGGRVSNQVAARRQAARAANERLRRLVEGIAAEVAGVANEIVRLSDQRVAADLHVARIDRLAAMLGAIVREDAGRRGELVQVRSRLLQARVARLATESRLREQEIALERLVGTESLDLAGVPSAFLRLPRLPEFLAQAEESPLLRQLEAEAAAQASAARAQGSARLPQLSGVVARSPLAPGLSNAYATSAGVVVSIPLYRGGSDRAAEQAALSRATGLRERVDQVRLDLDTRLRTLHEAASARLARADDHIRLLAESERVRRDSFELWEKAGRRTLFELLSLEGEHHALRLAWLDALHDAVAASARMRGESGQMAAWLGLPATEAAAP